MTIHESHAVDPASVLLPRTVQVDLTWLYADLQASLRSPDQPQVVASARGRDAAGAPRRSRP